MKNNKTNIFITGLALLMLLIVTISATYAYFDSKFASTNALNVSASTSDAATFTAYTVDQIEFTVTADDFFEPSPNPSKSDNGQVVAKLSSPVENKTVYCSYDIDLVWDTENQYTSPSMIFNNEYKYEISLLGNQSVTGDTTGYVYSNSNLTETNLTDFTWSGDIGSIGRSAKVVSGAKIYSKSMNPTTVTWNFTLNFYTLPEDQSAIMAKNYGAHLAVTNVVC